MRLGEENVLGKEINLIQKFNRELLNGKGKGFFSQLLAGINTFMMDSDGEKLL